MTLSSCGYQSSFHLKPGLLVSSIANPPLTHHTGQNSEAFQLVSMDDFDVCLVLGDFNVNVNPLHQSSPNRTKLLEMASEFTLDQLVTSVTHPLDQNNPSVGSTIDLVFSNRPDRFSSVSTTPSPVESDHFAVNITFRSTTPPPRPAIIRSFLQFHRGDFDHLGMLIHLIPWSAFMDPNDINSSTEIFTDILDAAIRDSNPKTSRRRTRFSPWITQELKKTHKQETQAVHACP